MLDAKCHIKELRSRMKARESYLLSVSTLNKPSLESWTEAAKPETLDAEILHQQKVASKTI